jgi:hypothetical protein
VRELAPWAAAAGTAAGAAYFAIGESSIPKEADCNYLASPATDVLAWAAGSALVARGINLRSPLVAFLGGAMIGIHLAQYGAHKSGQRIKQPERSARLDRSPPIESSR